MKLASILSNGETLCQRLWIFGLWFTRNEQTAVNQGWPIRHFFIGLFNKTQMADATFAKTTAMEGGVAVPVFLWLPRTRNSSLLQSPQTDFGTHTTFQSISIWKFPRELRGLGVNLTIRHLMARLSAWRCVSISHYAFIECFSLPQVLSALFCII
jgi:hypothetical protein